MTLRAWSSRSLRYHHLLMVTSAVTSAIISTRSEARRIQLTRCLRTSCTAVNFDYEEIVDPVPHRKYLQVNTVPYA